jgi:MoaA/NifB/PqqE/SkfB family radical SAM enzyme
MGDPYAANKAFLHCDRLAQYQSGGIPAPVQVHFVISDLCNHNCSFCAYRIDGYTEIFATTDGSGSVNKNPNRQIATPKAKEILKELSEFGARAIQFTGGGEPTMHPDCANLMLYANSLGLDTALVTNGSRIDDKMIDAIMKCTWMRISLDHANVEGYASMRSVRPEMFDIVLENVAKIVAAKKESGANITIGLGYVVNKANWTEVVKGASLAKSLSVDNFRISAAFTPEGADYFKDFYPDARDLCKEAEELGDDNFMVSNRFGERIRDLEADSPDYKRCLYQYLCTFIGADLNLYRCCLWAYRMRGIIGSLRDSSFAELWRNNRRTKDLKTFDAKIQCGLCQFNEKNRSTAAVLDGSAIEHGNFV